MKSFFLCLFTLAGPWTFGQNANELNKTDIDNTMKDLNWKPEVNMADALKGIFDHYRVELEDAKHLVD